jgi:hypothetical protein
MQPIDWLANPHKGENGGSIGRVLVPYGGSIGPMSRVDCRGVPGSFLIALEVLAGLDVGILLHTPIESADHF